ncbi:hypothetical protein [Candidatus Alkanophaga liquidiphilum]
MSQESHQPITQALLERLEGLGLKGTTMVNEKARERTPTEEYGKGFKRMSAVELKNTEE